MRLYKKANFPEIRTNNRQSFVVLKFGIFLKNHINSH